METALFIARAIGNVALILMAVGTFWLVLVVTP
jgi:hypothetical protein